MHPRWTTESIPERYPTFIVVSRETFTLRLFKHLKLARTFRIAVGRAGLETPAGLYQINDKQVNPSWHVPLSAWAGDLAGRIIPPGPADPIKARWMGFWNGAGIHGTDEVSSIGSAASHGCIRMTIPDVEALYPLVPLHTPIYVGLARSSGHRQPERDRQAAAQTLGLRCSFPRRALDRERRRAAAGRARAGCRLRHRPPPPSAPCRCDCGSRSRPGSSRRDRRPTRCR